MQNFGRIAPRERGDASFVARMSAAISGTVPRGFPDVAALIRATGWIEMSLEIRLPQPRIACRPLKVSRFGSLTPAR